MGFGFIVTLGLVCLVWSVWFAFSGLFCWLGCLGTFVLVGLRLSVLIVGCAFGGLVVSLFVLRVGYDSCLDALCGFV